MEEELKNLYDHLQKEFKDEVITVERDMNNEGEYNGIRIYDEMNALHIKLNDGVYNLEGNFHGRKIKNEFNDQLKLVRKLKNMYNINN